MTAPCGYVPQPHEPHRAGRMGVLSKTITEQKKKGYVDTCSFNIYVPVLVPASKSWKTSNKKTAYRAHATSSSERFGEEIAEADRIAGGDNGICECR